MTAGGHRRRRVAGMPLLPAMVLLVTGLLPDPAAAAGAARAAHGASLGLHVDLSTFYDDNILEYSGSQIALFESGTRPDEFSLQTRDDLELFPAVALNLGLDSGHGRKRSLKVRGSGRFHVENGTADFRSVSLAWQESFRRDRRLSLSYYDLPSYYLRQLHDEDTTPPYPGLSRYRRAEFGLQIGSAAWRQPLSRRVRADVSYQYERRRYNADFRERDSGLHQGEVEIEWDRSRRGGTFDLTGGYQVSRARGEDGDEPAGQTPDDPDLSYHGMVAGAASRLELARRKSWRLAGDLDYRFETRAYDSSRPSDKYHYRRDDRLHAVEAGLGVAYRPHWSLRTFCRFEDNRTTLGSAAPASSEAGSYRDTQVGIEIGWSGEVWSQHRPAAPSGKKAAGTGTVEP